MNEAEIGPCRHGSQAPLIGQKGKLRLRVLKDPLGMGELLGHQALTLRCLMREREKLGAGMRGKWLWEGLTTSTMSLCFPLPSLLMLTGPEVRVWTCGAGWLADAGYELERAAARDQRRVWDVNRAASYPVTVHRLGQPRQRWAQVHAEQQAHSPPLTTHTCSQLGVTWLTSRGRGWLRASGF